MSAPGPSKDAVSFATKLVSASAHWYSKWAVLARWVAQAAALFGKALGAGFVLSVGGREGWLRVRARVLLLLVLVLVLLPVSEGESGSKGGY